MGLGPQKLPNTKEGIPKVSVIMPTYNCGKYIAESVQSVCAQTMPDWELIIVDDCSTDNTQEILQPYLQKFPNIHYYKLEQNSGPAVARTAAIQKATGKYIAFLDSDDLWLPEKLEKQIAFMRKKDVVFSCTAYEIMDEKGKRLHTAWIPPEKTDYKKCVRLSDPIGNLTVMYDQEVLGKFAVPAIKKRNDFALWLQILKRTGYCAGYAEVLAVYRLGRKTSVSTNKLYLAKYHWQLYHKIEGMNVLASISAMMCWAFVKGTGIGLKKVRVD